MTEENKQMITIDDVEYAVEDLGEDAIKLINLITKSNQREADLAFDLDQIRVARQLMFNDLKAMLPQKEEASSDEQSD